MKSCDPHFNQATQFMVGNLIKGQHFEDWKLLNILWPIRRGNACSFISYYQTLNQKDKLVYSKYGKNHVFYLQKQNLNCDINISYNLYRIHTWIGMQQRHVHIYRFFSFQSYINMFQ